MGLLSISGHSHDYPSISPAIYIHDLLLVVNGDSGRDSVKATTQKSRPSIGHSRPRRGPSRQRLRPTLALVQKSSANVSAGLKEKYDNALVSR